MLAFLLWIGYNVIWNIASAEGGNHARHSVATRRRYRGSVSCVGVFAHDHDRGHTLQGGTGLGQKQAPGALPDQPVFDSVRRRREG